jgi:hypothetical protein
LYFSEIELPSGRSLADPPDFVEAQALATWLKRAKTRLVVIASGDSLALATELLDCTNVISPHGIFSASALSRWIATFYLSIKTSTIAEACALASAQSRVPMKLLSQQVPTDVQLEFQPQNAASPRRTRGHLKKQPTAVRAGARASHRPSQR